MYERSCLEEQVRTHHFESLDGANSKLGSGMHGLLRLDGCHDNSGAVFSSPESTLKWDTISEGSEDVEYNRSVSLIFKRLEPGFQIWIGHNANSISVLGKNNCKYNISSDSELLSCHFLYLRVLCDHEHQQRFRTNIVSFFTWSLVRFSKDFLKCWFWLGIQVARVAQILAKT